MRQVVASDASAHRPDDPSDLRWQESFCIVWHDPLTGSGGNHHFSLWRNKGIADVWSWFVLDGVEVGREQENELPIPDEDLLDTKVGGMRVQSGGDFCQYVVTHEYDGCIVEIRYRAYCEPVELDYSKGGARLGKRHYETLGCVEVRAMVGERELALTGVAFQDHSWGPRELGCNPAGRFFFTVFGEDLMAVVYSRLTLDGLDQDGWVRRDGHVSRVSRASIEADIGTDGLVPHRCRCDVWTDNREGLRITGTVQAGAIEGGIGLLAGDGLMLFECGGRLGGGMLEVKPLRAPLPSHRRVLNIPDGDTSMREVWSRAQVFGVD
jgi:hypothetical protein